jgi:hypothetical protein
MTFDEQRGRNTRGHVQARCPAGACRSYWPTMDSRRQNADVIEMTLRKP